MFEDTSHGGADGHRLGHLMIIGGAEDRDEDKVVLRRFVALARTADPHIVILTAGDGDADDAGRAHDRAFGDLGVARRTVLRLRSREDANASRTVQHVLEADGLIMTGVDQKRLVAMVGGTELDDAMHRAYRGHGACVCGTSAGASALAEHMLADGGDSGSAAPVAALAAGLGFLQRVVIDQHFSERNRLGRLLQVVAQNPYLLGIGIDENTALIVEPGGGIEVVGDGAVTLIDGRQMSSNFLQGQRQQALELVDVKLHLLPAGASHGAAGADLTQPRPVPEAIRDVVAIIASHGAAQP